MEFYRTGGRGGAAETGVAVLASIELSKANWQLVTVIRPPTKCRATG